MNFRKNNKTVFRPRSDVWNYFINNVKEGKAVCKICNKSLTNNRCYCLRQHLEKMHYAESKISNYFRNASGGEGVAMCTLCNTYIKNNHTYILMLHLEKTHDIKVECKKESNVSSSIKLKKETLVRSVLGLMVDDGVIPQVFNSKNMQALLNPMCELLKESENIALNIDGVESERVICSLATKMRDAFSNDLYCRLLSLKIDTDPNAFDNKFCLSALFIKDAKLHTYALGIIEPLDNLCTEKNIKEILHKFSIDSNQVISAFWDDTKMHQCSTPVDNSNYLNEIKNFELVNEIPLGAIKIERYVGCSAQLCILDLLKNNNILELFLQCRNFVKFINDESNVYLKVFTDNNLSMPQLDSPWQWGSTYIMIKHLYEARNVLKHINYEYNVCPQGKFKLDDNFWAFIDAFCNTVGSMQKALIRYYSEDMHFGDFYAQWLKCKLSVSTSLQNYKNRSRVVLNPNVQNSQNHFTTIATTLLESIENRSNEFLKQDRFLACLYLDPRFHQTLNLQQICQAQNYLKKLWTHLKVYKIDQEVKVLDSAAIKHDIEFEDNENEFLNGYLKQNFHNTNDQTLNAYHKLEKLKLTFQPVNTDILKFWKDQACAESEVYDLSEICFAIPATQIYNKIQYTHFYKNVNYKYISTVTKENLIRLRLNAHLLDSIVEQNDFFTESDNEDIKEEVP